MPDRFQLWPLVDMDNGEKSIPDWWLSYFWELMHKEGKDAKVFYTGGVKTTEEWLGFIKNPHNFPVFVMDSQTKNPVFVAWLNSVGHGTAEGHFCAIGRYQPGSAEMVLNYWKSFIGADGTKFLNVIIGISPETYTRVFDLLYSLGFVRIGVIPELCFLAYEKKRVGGIVNYFLMEDIDNGKR